MTAPYLWKSAISKSEIKKTDQEIQIKHAKKQIILAKNDLESVRLIKSKVKKYNIAAVVFPVTVFTILVLFYEFQLLHYISALFLMLPFFAFAYYFKFNNYYLILVKTNKEKICIDANSKRRKEIKSLYYNLNDWKPKK